MLELNSINVHSNTRHSWHCKSENRLALQVIWEIFLMVQLKDHACFDCEILHSVRGLYDKNSASQYCFTSDVMYKWHKRLVYTHPDFVFPFLINLDDQEPLWLLNVIEDDCYFGLSCAVCKLFFAKITQPFTQKSHECDLKLTKLWNTS